MALPDGLGDDAYLAALEETLAPLLDAGVLGPGALPRNEETARTLSIRNVDQPLSEARIFPRERVVPERIVKPDALWVVERKSYDRLVLSACHPLYSAAKRIVVLAKQVDAEPSSSLF